MQIALAQKGTHASLRTVYRTMSEVGHIHRHRRPHCIIKADTETQNRENLIKINFSADKPLKKLLNDITEVQCADGKLYVSSVLDCYNGELVALEMRDKMKKELCIDTVKLLCAKYDKLQVTILRAIPRQKLFKYIRIVQKLHTWQNCQQKLEIFEHIELVCLSCFESIKKRDLFMTLTYDLSGIPFNTAFCSVGKRTIKLLLAQFYIM